MSIVISRRLALAAAGAAVVVHPARAAGESEREIVDKSRITVEAMRRDKDMQAINGLLPRSKGVIVIPSLLKAGFILGAEGGSGVLLGRGVDGTWSAPAFVTMGAGSIGLQIGAQDAEVMFLLMTQKGLDQVLKSEFKLGAEASIAAGPVGMGVAAATTLAVGADVYSYARTRGAFVGGSFSGAVIAGRESWNANYYGKVASTRDIVINRRFTSTYAKGLQDALSRPAPAA
jgi:lipid-binding SYLF domain-containing protein